MNVPEEFKEIRPYEPEELPEVYNDLLRDEDFRHVVETVMPQMPWPKFSAALRGCHTNLEVQKTFFYPLLQHIEDTLTRGLDFDASHIDLTKRHTFISNHRDIVLDSAFLAKLLIQNGCTTTTEIAIGDNLLIYPWIKKLVRLNKSFIVLRSAGLRQMLETSARMSRYMHFAITEKKENIWIAQREGRAKDANDRTQDALLKMMAMGGEGDVTERLKALRLVPLSISYEYDPCDYLKAMEFQQKRDNPDFKKSKADDLKNMQTGIFGFKGHVHYQAAPCINDWLDRLPKNIQKQQLFLEIATHIDKEIHKGYQIYPCNHIACDLLQDNTEHKEYYSEQERLQFETYLKGQIAKVSLPDKDETFLRERLLTMYANPLINQTAARKDA